MYYLYVCVLFVVSAMSYYWPYFKPDQDEEIELESNPWNLNNHRGYAVKELYVEKKYDTFKEEMLHYNHISILDHVALLLNSGWCL